MLHHQIVIIGGGNAGISTAAQLLRKNRSLDIAIMDPSDRHYYQPAWTLVGGGVFDIRKTERTEVNRVISMRKATENEESYFVAQVGDELEADLGDEE